MSNARVAPKAPKGEYRVILNDTYCNDVWHEGDFSCLNDAKECADSACAGVSHQIGKVFDDKGNRVAEFGSY